MKTKTSEQENINLTRAILKRTINTKYKSNLWSRIGDYMEALLNVTFLLIILISILFLLITLINNPISLAIITSGIILFIIFNGLNK